MSVTNGLQDGKMYDIKFVKWMVEKAGWKIGKDIDGDEYAYYTDDRWISIDCIGSDPVINSFLMNNAIHGVNKYSYFNNFEYEIILRRWGIDIINHRLAIPNNKVKYFRYESNGAKSYLVDNANESALKYIYEQERNNNEK